MQWDIATGKELVKRSFKGLNVAFTDFSPDGKLFASSTDRMQILDLATGREGTFDALASGHPIRQVVFSSDGRLLVGVHEKVGESLVGVWETATGKVVLSFPWPYGGIRPMQVSPDGRVLASAYNNTVLTWDLSPSGWDAARLPKDWPIVQLLEEWQRLGAEDAPAAYRAVWTLTAAKDKAAVFLKDRLRPVQVADPDRAGGAPGIVAGESLRRLRAIQVLERIATPAAREVLAALASGSPTARETLEASLALQRLKWR